MYLSLRIEFEVDSRNLNPNVAPVCVLGPFSHRWLSSVLCENRQLTHLAPEHVIVECQAIWSCCKMFSNVYQSSIFINFLRKPIVIHSSIETEIYKIHLYDTSLSIDRNLQANLFLILHWFIADMFNMIRNVLIWLWRNELHI